MLKQWMLSVFTLLFTTMVFAQTVDLSKGLIEGTHYITLPKEARQQAVVQTFLQQDKGKIQVAEFFSYKCPGCFGLSEVFDSWTKRQPQDVVVRHVPVAFGPTWEPLAKTYYVLEELKAFDRLNPVIFNAVHREGNRLETQEEIAALLEKHGIPTANFNAAYTGFNVSRLWSQAQLLRQAEQVTSIPAVVVNGEYLTHLGMVSDPVLFTQVVDHLIAKSRQTP